MSSDIKNFFGLVGLLTENEYGYCYALNPYLAEKYGINRRTIPRWNATLTAAGLVRVEILRGKPRPRRIHLTEAGRALHAAIKNARKSVAQCPTDVPPMSHPEVTNVPPMSHIILDSVCETKNLITTTESGRRAASPPRPASPMAKNSSVVSVQADLDSEQRELLAALTAEGVDSKQATQMVQEAPEIVKHNLAALKALRTQKKTFRNVGGWLASMIRNNVKHPWLAEIEQKKAADTKRAAKADDAVARQREDADATWAMIEGLPQQQQDDLRVRGALFYGVGKDPSERLIRAGMIRIYNES
ncbi:hypothetical protein [Capsulimonas corticalis]|nr:hypothetical protein [Capsulimonas corticalis]